MKFQSRSPRSRRSTLLDAAATVGGWLAGRSGFDADRIEEDAQERADHGLPDRLHRPGLERLCADFGGPAQLSPFGALMARSQLVANLENRIILDRVASLPFREAEPPEPPVVIVGLPRSGTTILQQLFALDPATRVLRAWEVQCPTPPPRAPVDTSDERYRKSRRAFRLIGFVSPQAAEIHHVEPQLPTECIALLANSFSSMEFAGLNHTPTHLEWTTTTDMTDHYAFLAAQLRVLGSGYAFDRWVLKSPAHLNELATTAKTFPGVRFVWTHREPHAALRSHVHLTSVLHRIGSAAVDPTAIAAAWTPVWARALGRAMQDRGALRDNQFVDVWHRDLIVDPLAVVRSTYAGLGWIWSESLERRVVAHLAHNPRRPSSGSTRALDPFADIRRCDDLVETYRRQFDLNR